MTLEFSPLARTDLLEVLQFIAEDKPQAAIRFVSEIEYRCKFLTQFPNLGTSRDNLIEGLRVFVFRSYGIYYRLQNDVLRIERVLSPGFGYFARAISRLLMASSSFADGRVIKRRSAEIAEEILEYELCVLCDSEFPTLD